MERGQEEEDLIREGQGTPRVFCFLAEKTGRAGMGEDGEFGDSCQDQ